jgi:hypothetical protein
MEKNLNRVFIIMLLKIKRNFYEKKIKRNEKKILNFSDKKLYFII